MELVREILRSLSTRDLELGLVNGDVEVRPSRGHSVRLPLRVISDRGPHAVENVSSKAFNLFIHAGPRLTVALQQAPISVAAVGTSTGLLQIRMDSLLVDVQRQVNLPRRVRSGPKLQGLSELVAEVLTTRWKGDALPSLKRLSKLSSGALEKGPSVPQVQKVLARLEAEGILNVDRSSGPKFTRYFDLRKGDLLRLWSREHMPSVSASKDVGLYVTARDPDAVLGRLKRASFVGRWAVRGPAAAQLWRPTLAPGPRIELWTDDQAWDEAIAMSAPVEDQVANLTIRRLAGSREPLWFAHHDVEGGIPLISPARAFVETAGAAGPRLDELADALYESIT